VALCPSWIRTIRSSEPGVFPSTLSFHASDDGGASGGIVHEVIKIDGCTIYDGDYYGTGNGLLSDDVLTIDLGELCRIAADCGFASLYQPEMRVEATDCGGNVGYDSRTYAGGFTFRPELCSPAAGGTD
jgi:hypothetical protein